MIKVILLIALIVLCVLIIVPATLIFVALARAIRDRGDGINKAIQDERKHTKS